MRSFYTQMCIYDVLVSFATFRWGKREEEMEVCSVFDEHFVYMSACVRVRIIRTMRMNEKKIQIDAMPNGKFVSF